MRIISLDIETTGIDPNKCQILEFAAVLFDTDLYHKQTDEMPYLHLLIEHMKWEWEETAYKMNLDILEQIQQHHAPSTARIIGPEMLTLSIKAWLDHNHWSDYNHKTNIMLMNVAGKNPQFDVSFLERMPSWSDYLQVRRRFFDPAIYYVNLSIDKALPSLKECVERAQIMNRPAHRALNDARTVVDLLKSAWDY